MDLPCVCVISMALWLWNCFVNLLCGDLRRWGWRWVEGCTLFVGDGARVVVVAGDLWMAHWIYLASVQSSYGSWCSPGSWCSLRSSCNNMLKKMFNVLHCKRWFCLEWVVVEGE